MSDAKPAASRPPYKGEGGGRGGKGRGSNRPKHHSDSLDPDSAGGNRRKRPEVQHYKPGAFSTKREDENDNEARKKTNREEEEAKKRKKKPEQPHYVAKGGKDEAQPKPKDNRKKDNKVNGFYEGKKDSRKPTTPKGRGQGARGRGRSSSGRQGTKSPSPAAKEPKKLELSDKRAGILRVDRAPSPGLPPSCPHPASADRRSHSPPPVVRREFSNRHRGRGRGGYEWRDEWGPPKAQQAPKSLPPRFLRSQIQQQREDWTWRAEEPPTPSPDLNPPSSASKVHDWSVEVEEEEAIQRRKSESEHSSLRENIRTMMESRQAGLLHIRRPSEEPHPAWRGVTNPGQSQRYLFDHKNPDKPIAVGAGGLRLPSNNGDNLARFPLDPRFARPAPLPAGLPPYRPPFPPPQQAPPNVRAHQNKESVALINTIEQCEHQIGRILHSGGGHLLCRLWTTDVAVARAKIKQAFQRLLETDLLFCYEFDAEFLIWKICFYRLVENLKTVLKDDGGHLSHDPVNAAKLEEVKKTVQRNISDLLDEGLDFYLEMLHTLDRTYSIGLEKYYDVLEPRSNDKRVRFALISAQKCLLCLGDLARYKEQIQHTTNFGKARQYYQKASHIDTRNGRPYNQLAILAGTTKRRFEAVYFNMRCLSTKSPVASSKECLTVMFEEVSKKWEAAEQRRIEEKEQRRKEAQKVTGTQLRREIWLRPDGRRLQRTTSAQEELLDTEQAELSNLSTSDLNRRFNNTFLYLIGKLFTHINMDTFPAAAELLQKEFRILLSRSPLPIDAKRLVQIMALNMFVIDDTQTKDTAHRRTVPQNSALQLAFNMFGVLLERCNVLMQGFEPDVSPHSHTIFPDDDLPTLLAAVKVWCDWLLENSNIWYPVVCADPFQELAKLATHLERIKPNLNPILAQFIDEKRYTQHPQPQDYEMIKLNEDALLCGFNPWFRGLDWTIYRRYCHKSVIPSLAQDVRRLDAINDCIDYLEGFEPPMLKWSKPDNAHISLVENEVHLDSELSDAKPVLDEKADVEEEGSKASCSEVNEASDKIKQLRLRKEELEKREAEDQHRKNQLAAEHISVTLEVCPKIIVPDTNCFVDFLPDLNRLSSGGEFQLRVPLVVLNELDGLAKGARPTKYASQEHAAMVAENARSALNFLQDKPPNTKCVTSLGTVLPSLTTATEASNDQGKKNDDLILDTCLKLSQDATSQQTSEEDGQTRHVYREVVLLTDDRNLKLKAHTTDIPVNTLADFIKWAYNK